MSQYIDIHYSQGDTSVTAKAQYQYNRGQKLRIFGISKELLKENNTTYVHFSVYGMPKPISRVAEFMAEYGGREFVQVDIPSVLFTQKTPILAYVYRSSEELSKTVFKVEIPVIERPVPDGYDLTDEEMDDIEKMIADLRDATDKAEALSDLTVSAETLEPGENATAIVTESGAVKNIHFGLPKGNDGGYYKPTVNSAGQLTWTPTNDSMPLPDSVNIRGPVGPAGAPGETPTISSSHNADNGYTMVTFKTSAGTRFFTIPDGKRGDPGIVPIVNEVNGNLIEIKNSAKHNLQKANIYGKATQTNILGAQLIDINAFKEGTASVSVNGNEITLTAKSDGAYKQTKVLPIKYFEKAGDQAVLNLSYEFVSATNPEHPMYITSYWVKDGVTLTEYKTDFNLTYPKTENKHFYVAAPVDDCYFGIIICVSKTDKTVTGDSVTIKNLMAYDERYLQDLKIKELPGYEPYTGGVPSPSPSLPQEIKTVGSYGDISISTKVGLSDGGGNEHIAIITQPKSATAPVGTTVVFAVDAVGVRLSYQWIFENSNGDRDYSGMPGNKTANMSVEATEDRNGYKYWCVIKDANGNTVTTEAATLTIGDTSATENPVTVQTATIDIPVTPEGGNEYVSIIRQPRSVTAMLNANITFEVLAKGDGLTYAWQWKDATAGGSWAYSSNDTANTSAIRVIAEEHRNGYSYRCVITDAQNNQVITEEATLTIGDSNITQPTTPIGLLGLPVSSGGNYTDENDQQWITDTIEYNSDTNMAKYVKRVNCKLMQDVSWGKSSNIYVDIYSSRGSITNALPGIDIEHADTMMCTHFVRVERASDFKRVGQFTSSKNNIEFAFAEKDTTEITDFEQWLSKNEMYVIYVLAEPIVTEFSADEFAELKTYYPHTVIYNSDNAHMEIEYVADTKIYLDDRIDEIPAGPAGPQGERGEQGPRGQQGLPGFTPILENKIDSVVGINDSSECSLNKLTIYGKSIQNGTPSASDPALISSVGSNGNVEINVNGANIVDWTKPSSTTNITDFTSSENGSEISISGLSAFASVSYSLDHTALKGKTLYCSIESKSNTLDDAKTGIQLVYEVNGNRTYNPFHGVSQVVKLPNDVSKIFVHAVCNNTADTLASANTFTFTKPMITVIENVDEWKQYKSQTETVSIPVNVCKNITISEQPKNVTTPLDAQITFSVIAGGQGLTYQWYLFNPATGKWAMSAATGAVTNTITFKSQSHHDGCRWYCKINDASGNSVRTVPGKLTIDESITEPVYEAIEIPAVLYGLPVTNNGNYTDANGQQWIADSIEYDAETGHTKYIKRVARIGAGIILGDVKKNANENIWRLQTIDEIPNVAYAKGICTHYGVSTSYGNANSNNEKIAVTAAGLIIFRDDTITTVTEAYDKLTSEDFEFIYPLATPIETVISNEQIANLHTYYPYTTVTNSYGTDLNVEYVADTKKYVGKVVPGPQGEQGVQGSQGPQGVPGMPGVLPILETASGSILDLKGTANYPLQKAVVYGHTSLSGTPSVDSPATLINAAEDKKLGIAATDIKPSIAIKLQPADTEATQGETIVFKVEAEGTFLSYQWMYSYNNGETWTSSTLIGNDTPVLSMEHRPYRDGYLYRCKITDAYGNIAYSNIATTHDGTSKTFRITGQPADVTTYTGETIKFKVEAEGEGLTYKWKLKSPTGTWNDSSAQGCNTNEITFKVLEYHNGYQYYCEITDANGETIPSNVVTITFDENALYECSKIEFDIPNKLSSVPVSSNGTYVDQNGQHRIADTIEYDAETGVTEYVQRIGHARIQGTGWTKTGTNVDRYYRSIKETLPGIDEKHLDKILCTHFSYATTAESVGLLTTNIDNIGFAFAEKDTTQNEDFEQWLSANEVHVTYILATPIKTVLSTVYMKDLKPFYPNSIIFNSANAYMNIEYALDTKSYVDNSITAYEKYINDLIEAKIGVIENGTY